MPDHLLLPERIQVPSRRQGGGGGGAPPRNPRRHGTDLERQLQRALAVGREIRVTEGVDPGLVFKITAVAGARLEDADWARRGLTLLGDTEDWTYFVLSAQDMPTQFSRELDEYTQGEDEEGGDAPLKSFFNALEGIRPYGPDDRRAPDLPAALDDLADALVVDVIVWPSHDFAEAGFRLGQVRRVLESHQAEEIASDDRPRFTVLRARVGGTALNALLGLSVVERVRLPPTPYLEPSNWTQLGAEDLVFRAEHGVDIGVIDDAIADGHRLFAEGGVASRREFPPEHPWGEPSHHGTMVAGLAAFGEFESKLQAGGVFVRRSAVHQARVLEPDPDFPERTRFAPATTAHQAVEAAIRTLHAEDGVRVFNLSVTDSIAYSGPHVSLWTESLDSLIRELDIVVVVAAGNRGVQQLRGRMDSGDDAWTDYPDYLLRPEGRVAEPAPAALALTTGSLARFDAPQTLRGAARVGDRAIASASELSPFSRTGPGAFKSTKPDLVEFGGNWVLNDADLVETENVGVGVISTAVERGGRLFRVSSGTSFSAPLIARLVADLWSAYPEASANLIRAFAGAAARVPPPAASQFPQDATRLRAVGYGRPSVDLAVASGGPRVVMYFDGRMNTDTVSIHPIPIPPSLVRGRAARRLTVALAFDPPVRRQRREYLAGSMAFDLLRNVTPEEVRERYERQGADRVELYSDRRRLNLKPGARRLTSSTLQVRTIRPSLLSADDGDVYYLAVTHQAAPWADPGEQRYALAVELVEEERQAIDLYAEVQQQVRIPARVRVRT